MTSNWDKFVLLMWKNWRLQWNHKKQLIIEIALPVLFATLLIVVRSLVDPNTYPDPTKFPIKNIQFSLSENVTVGAIKRLEVAYYPNSKCLEDVGEFAKKWLTDNNDLENDDDKKIEFYVTGYDNVTELNKQVKSNGIIAAIQFDDSLNAVTCPNNISYSIRFPSELRSSTDLFGNQLANWQTNILFPIFDFGGPRISKRIPYDLNPSYYLEGFIGIQHAFALGFIEKFKKVTEDLPEINIQRFPYPPYVFDPILTGLESFISLIILICFVYPVSQTVKYVTTEKEKQLKEVMKIMGLPNWLHWTAWFIKTYAMALVTVSLIEILFKVHFTNENVCVLTHSHWSILLFFLYIYCISMVTFCFMFATFFSRANTAAAVSGLVWFISYLPYQLTDKNYPSMKLPEKLGLSIFSNTAMAYGLKLILKLEGTGEGLQWDNLFRPVNVDDDLSVGLIIIMLLVDSVVYMLIALYVEKIFPGSFGVPEKWYFPFTNTYWCPSSIDYETNSKSNTHVVRSEPAAFEAEPKNKKIGLSIKNLHKDFGDKTAVNGLSMDMYEDEITVLLGHNGAGKTTTISMLTGMIPPSRGTAVLNGHDIRTNLMQARMSLGLCPQHNILFDELTVREHIIFFSRLKGLKKDEVDAEVEKYVNLLELENKIDTQSKKLSGGMKRKLSIAAALCGGSKVVLCDEPTSGMDPSARRALWDLLEIERKGRTILLSTHFMDEADVLGDRIAIMCSGELKAYGTSFFLKKRYGAGYHLICVKKDNCRSSEITNLLRQYIPDIIVESDIGTELSYQLPDRFSNCFEKMLTELEEKSNELKLNGYGISNTTLEEVFMLVGSDRQDINASGSNGVTGNGTSHEAQNKYTDLESSGDSDRTGDNGFLLTGIKLTFSQWKAMLLKKYLYVIRNYIMLIIQNFMPIFFIVITVLIYKTIDPFRELKPLKLDIAEYAHTVTVLESRKLPTVSFENEIVKEYGNYVQKFGTNHEYVGINEDFEKYIIEMGKKNLVRLNSRYIIGGTIALKNITAAFNAQLLHVLPVTLNAIHNAVLRAASKDSSLTIEVTNYPLPYDEKSKLQAKQTINFGLQLSLNLSFCMSFVSTFYVLFQIKERVSRAKLLQFVSGVRVLTFWLTQFFVDYLTYLITALIIFITIASFQQEGFSTGDELGRTFLVFVLFGISSLPLTYLWAFCFSDSATGFSRLSTFNVFTGMALSILVFFLNAFVEKSIVDTINTICLIFPHYLLSKSLDNISKISTTTSSCLKLCDFLPPGIQCNMKLICEVAKIKECCVPDYFAWEEPGIGSHIVYTFAVGIIIFAILFMKEYRLIDGLFFYIKIYLFEKFYKPSDRINPISTAIDEDVKEEKLKVSRMSPDEIKNTNLVLDHITKYYWKFLAVNDISAVVQHSECFGLLGVNGAGKTTTFKMLTGDERITYGETYVKGLSAKTNMSGVYREIGYCPQFDALLEDLTGRETLRIFALLRGIPENRIKQISDELSNGFGFTKHIDKPVKAYSGGNKRKLSASIALIGSPSVIYLDEPTTGMDPGAKRQLWNKVCQIRDTGKSIVLTSHSMEECEALCTRLAIMVNGEFKCIGSTQHLKNKFSKGLILKIKIHRDENSEHNPRLSTRLLRSLSHLSHNRTSSVGNASIVDEEAEKIIRFVKEHFTESEIKEQHQGLLTFYIPLLSIQWSKIFGIMEANKAILNIEDYSISQTTLEEIFLDFAKYQKNDSRVGQ